MSHANGCTWRGLSPPLPRPLLQPASPGLSSHIHQLKGERSSLLLNLFLVTKMEDFLHLVSYVEFFTEHIWRYFQTSTEGASLFTFVAPGTIPMASLLPTNV